MATRAAHSFALSLVAHVVLATIAVLLVRAWVVPDAPSRVTTRLAVELAVPAAAPASPGAVAAAPAIAPAAAPVAARPRPRRAAVAVAVAPAPSAEATPGIESGPGVGEASGSAPALAPASVIAPGSGALGPTPRPPALDPESVRSSVQRTIRYPPLARKRGLEGTVILRFRVLAGGSIEALTVVSSAGSSLDEAAQDAVRRAAPFSSGQGWVRIPVVFELRAAP